MDFQVKKINNIKGQECFDLNRVWFEIISSDEQVIGEIWHKRGDDYEIIIYNQNENIAISTKELENIINQAKSSLKETSNEKIVNMAKKLGI